MPTQKLRIILFGASGMVGAAVLEECLRDEGVEAVLSVGRSACGRSHPKLKELLHSDLFDLSPFAESLKGYNACFYALGVSSVGMKEADYSRIIVDLTVSVARLLIDVNPGMAFCFVSGAASDSTGQGKVMWARVKGQAENALLAMPFKPAVMIRLGGLVPLKGFRSKVRWIRLFYGVLAPLMATLAKLFPRVVITGPILGQAMIRAARGEATKDRLEPGDLHALGSRVD